MERPIDKEHYEHYNYLEYLRQSGVTNMFGAAPYLAEEFGIPEKEARQILSEWMSNYNELCEIFGWRE